MGKVDSAGSVIPPLPNSKFAYGDPGSSASQSRGATPIHPPGNGPYHTARPNNGFLPLTGQGRPADADGSNAKFKFNVANAQMPQPPSAIQPGHGAVPVTAFTNPNGTTPLARIPDKPKMAK
jgi:hypothetical protein